MATGAVARRGLIENNALAVNISMAGVAKLALYLFVGALEREGALSLVVENGWLPVFHIVTEIAALGLPGLDELAGVGVLVASRTICWS